VIPANRVRPQTVVTALGPCRPDMAPAKKDADFYPVRAKAVKRFSSFYRRNAPKLKQNKCHFIDIFL
jgi:hypothetical protein